jgi:DNA-directed RNA polymerase sigma subunit (sigma70/sigma32)
MSNKNSITCFKAHENNNVSCKNKKCRYWHELNSANNCIINASQEKTYTLQEIGDLFDITRMRVCQIEKSAIEKLKLKCL